MEVQTPMSVLTQTSGVTVSAGEEELFPIREVARLTGVNPVTLRAWERRHGLIVPTRTESGHRLYSMTDIERVRNILVWIERGLAVSKIGALLARAEPLQVLSRIIPSDRVYADYAQWQQQVQAAVSAFDDVQLGLVYGQVFSTYPQAVVFQDILMPVWTQLLQRQDRFGGASEWLFLDGFLRDRVLHRLLSNHPAEPRQVMISALSGQCRELELLVATLFLSADKIGVRMLNVEQPFDELALVCERIRPRALILFSNHLPAAALPRRLSRLAMTLDCQLMLAGEVSDLVQADLVGSSVGCLSNEADVMHQRLKQFLAGNLDT